MASESLLNFVENYEGNREELAVRQQRGYRTESWTYTQIAAQANRVARELELRGLGRGDAALLWRHNSAEWICAFLGCVLRGVVVVPIDHGSTLDFACRVAREVKARVVFRAHTHPEIGASRFLDSSNHFSEKWNAAKNVAER